MLLFASSLSGCFRDKCIGRSIRGGGCIGRAPETCGQLFLQKDAFEFGGRYIEQSCIRSVYGHEAFMRTPAVLVGVFCHRQRPECLFKQFTAWVMEICSLEIGVGKQQIGRILELSNVHKRPLKSSLSRDNGRILHIYRRRRDYKSLPLFQPVKKRPSSLSG